jgi:hypothetical protein
MAIRIAMMAMTTSSSIKVKPARRGERGMDVPLAAEVMISRR